jgi:hypothetical protein
LARFAARRWRRAPSTGRTGLAESELRRGAPAQAHYAALDLGTNNCRPLIARPARGGFRVVDAFSRIVRLGDAASSPKRRWRARSRRSGCAP